MSDTEATTGGAARSATAQAAAQIPQAILPFTPSAPFTMGIELELQLVNRRNYNLATDAVDLWGLIASRKSCSRRSSLKSHRA